MQKIWIRWLFAIAAVYDGILGLAFIFAAERLFSALDVTPPNHYGYVQFPALLLVLFAFLFAQIAAAPARWGHLMLYGAGLKAAYCTVVFYHLFFGQIQNIWVTFACADLVFLALFFLAWWRIRPATSAASSSALQSAAVTGADLYPH